MARLAPDEDVRPARLLERFQEAGQEKRDAPAALATATKAATAGAWGWIEKKTWLAAKRQIQVKTGPVL